MILNVNVDPTDLTDLILERGDYHNNLCLLKELIKDVEEEDLTEIIDKEFDLFLFFQELAQSDKDRFNDYFDFIEGVKNALNERDNNK